MKKIIAFAGEGASGKGVVSDYLVEKYDAHRIIFSSAVKDLLNRFYIPVDRENLGAASKAMRTTFGEDLFSKVIRKEVEESDAKLIVLDGARRKSDLDHLRDLENFKLVYIESSMETRYKRIFGRGQYLDEQQKTFDQFKKDHEIEADRTIPELKDIANVVIENNGTLEELHQKIDDLIANY